MDDLISKQDAQKAIENVLNKYGYKPDIQQEGYMAYAILHVLDKVQPKTGHWIKGKNIIQCYGYEDGKEVPRDTIYEYFECSECKNRVIYEETNYCPNCGVRMIEEGD